MNIDSIKLLPKTKNSLTPFYIELLEMHIQLKNNVNSKSPKTFFEIRSEIILGNKHIKHKGKPLYFYHWINSGIIYLNDILKDGQIDDNSICNKLKNHANWIMETLILKQSIPKSWKAKVCTYE